MNIDTISLIIEAMETGNIKELLKDDQLFQETEKFIDVIHSLENVVEGRV